MMGFLELQVDAYTEAWGDGPPKSMKTGASVFLKAFLHLSLYTSVHGYLFLPFITNYNWKYRIFLSSVSGSRKL